MSKTISVITPSYNQGKFIEQTIQSVLDQSISTLQYIVIDGGSTDETISILKKYGSKIEWVCEKDSGQANALNKGFQKAVGDIIGWLNSDDIYFADTLTTILDFFEQHPEIDVLYGDAFHINAHNDFINQYPTQPWSLKKFMNRCFISQPAVFFRRHLFKQSGFLDESLHYCMDYEFWLRLAVQGARFYHLEKTLAATRLHSDAKTVGQSVRAHAEQIRMIRRYRKVVSIRMILSYIRSLVCSLRM